MRICTLSKVLLLVLLTVLSISSCTSLVKIPITRHPFTKNGISHRPTLKMIKNVAKNKQQPPTELPIDTHFNNLHGAYEFSFNITIGTPPQNFSIALDIGGYEDGDFWVTSVACDPLYFQCRNHHQYDHRNSATFNSSGDSFQTPLGTTGLLSSDTMAFGPIQIKLQKFGAGWNFPSRSTQWNTDGMYGFSPMEHLDTGLTPFYNMVKQGILPEPIVGLYTMPGNSSLGGELVLGGRDSNHYQGQLAYLDLEGSMGLDGWKVKMDGVTASSSNTSFCVGGCEVVLSNEDPYFLVSAPEGQKLNRALGAKFYMFGSIYTEYFQFDCKNTSSLSPVVLQLAGKKFTIQPEQYVLRNINGDSVCVSAFLVVDQDALGYDWKLGTAFFETAYVEFNLQHNQVGLALSKIP